MINCVQTVPCSVQCTRQRASSMTYLGCGTGEEYSGVRQAWAVTELFRGNQTHKMIASDPGGLRDRARSAAAARRYVYGCGQTRASGESAQPVSDYSHRRGQDAQTDDGTHHTHPPRHQRAVFARSSDQPKLAQISTRLVEVARKVLRHVAHKALTRHRGVRECVCHICAVEAAHMLKVF